jgi:eukaryotic-like serine/threonine-protein kinase
MAGAKICPRCNTTYEATHRFCFLDGAALVAAEGSADLIGTLIAERYQIISKLGDGGMGQVYLAEHVRMRRKSAVKVIRSGLSTDPIAIGRFNREAQNASQINHPNVAAIYDFGETNDGLIYLAMEFVDGDSLAQILNAELALHPVRAADIIGQAADALSAAHAAGILHRDLKPDNIMVSRARSGADVVKLVDFGIARVMTAGAQQVTSTGIIVGTPEYMSPEQFVGEPLDTRSDNYSLALVAYFALTGKGAFPAATSKESLLARLTQPPRPLAEAKADIAWPAELTNVFNRALAADPAKRYADVLDFARDFTNAIAAMPATQTAEMYIKAISARNSTPTRSLTPSSTPRVMGPGSVGRYTPPEPTPALETEPVAVTPPPAKAAVSANGAPANGVAARKAPARPAPRSKAMPIAAGASALAAVAVVAAVLLKPGAADTTKGDTAAAPAATSTLTKRTADIPRRDSASARTPAAARAESTGAAATAGAPATPLGPIPVAALADSGRSIAKRFAGAVFEVSSPRGRGTAFLVDSAGLVLAPARVVPTGTEVEVLLDPDTRVHARIVVQRPNLPFTVLAIPMSRCGGCTVVPVEDSPKRVPAATDPVITISSQTRTAARVLGGSLTQASGDTLGARLKLAPQGVGAPVFDVAGSLVGAVHRRDSDEASRLVPAAQLVPLVRQAMQRLARHEVPPANDTLFPMVPSEPFPKALLTAAAARPAFDVKPYQAEVSGAFTVLAMTPPLMAWRDTVARTQLADRQRAAGATPLPYKGVDAIEQWGGWRDYIGGRAVVVLTVIPKVLAFPYATPERVEERRLPSIQSVRILRDGAEVMPIESALSPAAANVEGYRARRPSVPMQSVLVYRPDAFSYRDNGRMPALVVEITEVNGKVTRAPLPEAVTQRVLEDFRDWMGRRRRR